MKSIWKGLKLLPTATPSRSSKSTNVLLEQQEQMGERGHGGEQILATCMGSPFWSALNTLPVRAAGTSLLSAGPNWAMKTGDGTAAAGQ